MTTSPLHEVLIVGAGPTGLTMALELARHEMPFRIIGKAPGPAVESRAIGIVPRTMEIFDIMGIVDPFLDASHRLRGANVFVGSKRIAHLNFDDLDTRYFVAVLPQGDTERILAEQLNRKGITVEREVELTGVSQENDIVTARLRHKDGREEVCRTKWLIGCDGANSTVRTSLGINFAGERYEEVFVLADTHLESTLSWEESYTFLHSSGVLAMFPLPNNLVRVVAVLDEQSRTRIPGKPTLSDMQALVDERGPGDIHLTDAVWFSEFRVSRRMVQQFRHGRVFLAGDAAHVHSPTGGQGMNTGIQDANNLAWKLAHVIAGKSPETILDSYHVEREPVAKAVLQMADRNTRLGIPRNPLARTALNLLLSWVLGIEAIEHRMSEDFSELHISYRNSPLVAEDWGSTPSNRPRKAPLLGRRAPDIELKIAGSEKSVRLYELLREPRHILLISPGRHPTSNDLEKVTTIVQKVHETYAECIMVHLLEGSEVDFERRYGTDMPALYLVRPDGYIGFRGRPEIDLLEKYLGRLFLYA